MAKRMPPIMATGGALLSGLQVVTTQNPANITAIELAQMGRYRDSVRWIKAGATDLKNYYPLVGGAIGSILARKFGLNRMLPKGINL